MQFSLKAALRGGVAFSVGLTMAGFASTAARAETNWTGFYTGFAAGIANVHNSTDIQELCDYNGYDCAKRTTDSTGVSGSLYGGYMQPLPMGNIVVGVEGDVNYLSGHGQQAATYVDSAYDSVLQNHLDFLGTLRGRVGVTADNTLLYLTGGLAFGNVQHTYSYDNYGTQFKKQEMRVGWVAGAGVEHYLTDNISVRLEGLFGSLGGDKTTDEGITNASYHYYPSTTNIHFGNTNFAIARAGIGIKW